MVAKEDQDRDWKNSDWYWDQPAIQEITRGEILRLLKSPHAYYLLHDRAYEFQDIIHELYLKAYQAFSKFDPQRHPDPLPAYRNYIRRTLTNKLIDLVKKARPALPLYDPTSMEQDENEV